MEEKFTKEMQQKCFHSLKVGYKPVDELDDAALLSRRFHSLKVGYKPYYVVYYTDLKTGVFIP